MFFFYIYGYEYSTKPKANTYDASTLNFIYKFLCFIFSNIEGRIIRSLNIVGHVPIMSLSLSQQDMCGHRIAKQNLETEQQIIL